MNKDKDIFWKGNFEYCRFGMPNDYIKAYNAYINDVDTPMVFEEFKEAVHKWDDMGNYIQHKDLKEVEILMSYQRLEDGKELPSVIALGKSTQRAYTSEKRSNYGEIAYKTAYNKRNGQKVWNYYLFWGVDDRLEESGFELLTTRTGRKVSLKSALKTFNDARKATEFVNFSRI